MITAMRQNPTAAEALFQSRSAQVAARDQSADGAFVYAVRTTGVFCRPSCPSRAALPRNVTFYDTAGAAAAAGFRACRRCSPQSASFKDTTQKRMQALAASIEARADEVLSLDDLAAEAKMSPSHFQRTFKKALGVSPKAFHAAARLRTFKARLREGDSVLGAVFEAGYGSTSRIYEQVEGALGMTPTAYRSGGAGEGIVYAVRETRLGLVMMAATARGVCLVEFGDSADALEIRLRREFPHAELQPAGPLAEIPLGRWMEALEQHLKGDGPRPDLPLDLRGTAFQVRVWRFLLSVPEGAAASYKDLAAGVGAPRAVRAAASACGANRIAVLVPCHRALRSDGSLGGYRWGLERKRALLERESALRAARNETEAPVSQR